MRTLTVDGKLDSLQEIRDFVSAAANSAGMDERESFRLRQAVDEIATNIVLYGYQEAGLSGDISVEAQPSPDSLKIVLEDTGREYDPTQQRLPNEEELHRPLEDRPVGGLGIFLALKHVDEFLYQRKGNRNRNIFILRLPARLGT